MRKLLALFLLASCFQIAYAGGGIAHMFIAEQAISLLPDQELRNILLDNIDAYLVGSNYPDSGYVSNTGYGEDSHWNPFIYAFADYLKEKYPDPATQNPKLVAFLFGCATHRESDEIMHWTFYPEIQRFDRMKDFNTAHQHGDVGIDILLNIEKNQWLTHPVVWWVPVNDLLAVYHRMGKDQYTREEIIHGNKVLYFAGFGERLISPVNYPYQKWGVS